MRYLRSLWQGGLRDALWVTLIVLLSLAVVLGIAATIIRTFHLEEWALRVGFSLLEVSGQTYTSIAFWGAAFLGAATFGWQRLVRKSFPSWGGNFLVIMALAFASALILDTRGDHMALQGILFPVFSVVTEIRANIWGYGVGLLALTGAFFALRWCFARFARIGEARRQMSDMRGYTQDAGFTIGDDPALNAACKDYFMDTQD